MQIGMIGLGRMGANMVRRLMADGHECVVFNRDLDKVREMAAEGAIPADSLADFAQKLQSPRKAWVMVPAGKITEEVVLQTAEQFSVGDIIIDGGNSFFKDDIRRSAQLKARNITYMDVGTSGGIFGLERGYCLMIGGPDPAFKLMEPAFKTLAPGKGTIPDTPGRDPGKTTAEAGYLHCGPAGAGHFVKMIHNGIEYGMMQAYAEGFDILKNANSDNLDPAIRFDLNLADIAEVWRRGSVVSSWLLDLSATALAKDPRLSGFDGIVHDSGEGRWTINTAIEEAVPAEVLSAALFRRFRSRETASFAEKLLSAMRFQFGGHKE